MADITYIRLVWEFVYLAVILDAYSAAMVGWALEDTLEGKLRSPRCGWRWISGVPLQGWCIRTAEYGPTAM